jgi:hypothetical protein
MTHTAPTDGSWSAELVIAHIALTDELFAATARALLDGRPAAYDNATASFRPNLEHDIEAHGDRDEQLADARRRSQHLCALAEQLDDTTAATAVHVRVIDGATVTVDEPLPFATALHVHATIHLPTHTSDLMALAIPDRTVHTGEPTR